MDDVLFDDSLPRLTKVVRRELGDDALRYGVILRDATGRLSFVSASESGSAEERIRITRALNEALGPYARTDSVLAYCDEPGMGLLLQDSSRLPVQVDDFFCQLVDRRIVGAGWLETPRGEAKGPPRIVFSRAVSDLGESISDSRIG
jgi:hypothetical protein